MNDWYKRYVELMLRTRWLSILAAAVLLFLSGAEIFGFVRAWINHETAVTFENNLEDLLLLLCAGILVIALIHRTYILSARVERKYSRNIASWVAVVVPLIAFIVIWEIATRPIPTAPCDSATRETCYGIFVFCRSPPLVLMTPIFIGGSILRSLATLVVAKIDVQLKLK